MGNGSTNVMTLLKTGGAVAFIAAMGVSCFDSSYIIFAFINLLKLLSLSLSHSQGWYLFISLVLNAVGFPFNLPNPDLSSRVFSGKTKSPA